MKAAFEIGHILTILTPELTKNYENRNFKGCEILSELSDKYYHYTLSEKRVVNRWKFSIIIMVLSTLLFVPLSMIQSKDYLLVCIAVIIGSMLGAALYALKERGNSRKFVKDFLPAVKTFCEAAESLNSSRYWSCNILNKETVEAELVKMARDVLTEEERFDIMCHSGHSYVREILDHGHKILDNETKMNNALEAAAKFGLIFEKRELFSKAQARFRKL